MDFKSCHFQHLTPLELYHILQLREEVFVLEQECLYKDIDDIDPVAHHVFSYRDKKMVAYARIYEKEPSRGIVQVGRVIVKKEYRNKNIGLSLLSSTIQIATTCYHPKLLYLEAQTYAIPFYERMGFKVCSEEFLEDGIPHVQMIMDV